MRRLSLPVAAAALVSAAALTSAPSQAMPIGTAVQGAAETITRSTRPLLAVRLAWPGGTRAGMAPRYYGWYDGGDRRRAWRRPWRRHWR
jgi:hypothetical protein